MRYKIKTILHNGTMGKHGTERTDDMYPQRKGKTVEVNFDNWHVGSRLLMPYIVDEDDILFGKMMLSSPIEKINKQGDGNVTVVTENSIYYFEKLE